MVRIHLELITNRRYRLAGFLLLMSCAVSAQKDRTPVHTWITIDQMKSVQADTFMIKGQVIDRYECPPCPPGAMCKPCIGDHITIEDTEVIPPARTTVFTPRPLDYPEKAVFIFTLVLHNKSHPDFGGDLMKAESLKK